MRTITLEEHFATPGFLDGPGRKLKERAERSGGSWRTWSPNSSTSATAGSPRWTRRASTCRLCR